MRRFAAAIVLTLAAASFSSFIGCKRFKKPPPSFDAGSVSAAPTSTAPHLFGGASPGTERCEEYVVVTLARDPRNFCITDFGAPFTAKTSTGIETTIDPKALVLDLAQNELTLDAPKVTSPTTKGDLTFALSKRAALAVLEKMLDDFATGKTKNPIPASSAPLKKGKELTLVFLKIPAHGVKAGETLKDLKPGGRVYLRYDNTSKVRDFDRVVIAREGKEVFNKAECRYFTLGGATSVPEHSTLSRHDVAVDVVTYNRGADTSKVVKHFAAAKECPRVVDMDQGPDRYTVRVLPPLDKILEYVRAI